MSDFNWNALLDAADKVEDDKDYPVVEPGDYACTVTEATAETAKSSGNRMVKVVFTVDSGESFANAKLFTYIVLNTSEPKQMKWTFEKFAALNASREWISGNNPTLEQIASRCVGAKATVTVKEGFYQGKKKAEVKSFKSNATPGSSPSNPSPSPAPRPASDEPPVPASF